MTARRWGSLVALLLVECACSGKEPRCEKTEDCEEGKVCIVSVAGERGVCAVPAYGVALVAPAAGAKVNASGVEVKVEVQLAGPGGQPSGHVRARTRGGPSESCELTLSGQDGALLTYQGRCLTQTRHVGSVMLWAEVETSAGALLTDAVLLDVDGVSPTFPEGYGTVTCARASLCLRDEEIEVSIYVEEDSVVEASLDLEGFATTVSLQPGDERLPDGAQKYVARVPLKDLPFPKFAGDLAVRIVARDMAGNEAAVDLTPRRVTRVRWVYVAGAPVTSPAITDDGLAIAGVSTTTGQLRAVGRDGSEVWRATLEQAEGAGGSFVEHAPSIGPNTVWVGSEDGKLYGLKTDGTLLGSCPSSGQVTGSLFTPAVRVSPGEAAYTGGDAGNLYGGNPVDSSISCPPPVTASPSVAMTSPVVIVNRKLFVATATATVRRYTDVPAYEDGFDVAPSGECSEITAPMAVTRDGMLALACGIAQGKSQIHLMDPNTGASSLAAALPWKPTESIVILPTTAGPGDLIVGTNDGMLHRLGPPASGSEWTDVWTLNLGAEVTGTLVAKPAADGTGAVVYAVTSQGDLHALDASRATVWSTAGDISHPLGTYSLTFPTIAPAQPGRLPTLYVGSDEGKLYAVVVDTDLDTSSPWPKSHRDIQNTSNADLPIP